jgi:hypothetical protein
LDAFKVSAARRFVPALIKIVTRLAGAFGKPVIIIPPRTFLI